MFSLIVRQQIQAVAERNGIEPAALLAVADVESAGIAFWTVNGQSVPPARPEGHYFYRYLTGAKRAQAVKEGLANPNAGALKVPANRAAVYARIARMRAIDDTAALMSCSWGLGQVMGANFKSLGYASVQEMVDANGSVAGQVDCMWRFIKVNHLADEIKRRDWKGFARGYNGAGYAKNGYDRQIARAYTEYSKLGPVAAPLTQRAEEHIAQVGYTGPNAVKQFQTDKGLVPDGNIGTETREAAETAVKEQDTATGDKLVTAGIGTGGADAAIDKLNDSTMSLQWLAGGSDIISYLLVGLTIITVGLVCYGLYKKFKGS